MGRKFLSTGWLRAVGVALTLAGAIVVFVVLFMPTTASARPARSAHCTHSRVSFIGGGWEWVTKGEWKGYLKLFVAHSDAVSHVHFTADKSFGSHWVTANGYGYPDINTVYVWVPSEATDGPIRINHSSDPGLCYVQSSKTFHPQGGHGFNP